MTASINASTTAGVVVTSDTSGSLALQTAGTTAVTLDTSQNVGIGVTPSAWNTAFKVMQLGQGGAVYGHTSVPSTYLTSNSYQIVGSGTENYIANGFAAKYVVNNNAGTHNWYTAASGTAGGTISFTQAMTLDNSGNLGIGETSPSSYGKLTIKYASASLDAIHLTNTTTNGHQWSFGDGTGGTAGNFGFYDSTAGATRMVIDSSGNLLVGTTTTASGVSIFPSFSSSGASGIDIKHVSGSASGVYYETFQYNNSLIGYISQNGTTAVAYNTTSDYRLKNTISPITGALAKVALLKPCTYKWNADGSDGEGFIAHELAEVVPQCVTGEKDAVDKEGKPVYQGIDTSFLVATLTSAIQELNTLVNAQAAEITALKAKVGV